MAFSQWALELGSYAGLEGVSAVVISALSLRSHGGLFPGLAQGFILLDARWMNLDGSWQIAGQPERVGLPQGSDLPQLVSRRVPHTFHPWNS